MVYKEPHFDKAGAKSFMEALGAANAGQIKRKPAGAKKTPSKPSAGGKGKK